MRHIDGQEVDWMRFLRVLKFWKNVKIAMRQKLFIESSVCQTDFMRVPWNRQSGPPDCDVVAWPKLGKHGCRELWNTAVCCDEQK